jgi:tRNA nucleotidyltransferase/poly(A) polymerase
VKTFLVGGMVRDNIMGVPSKDADFSCVLDSTDFPAPGTTVSEPDPFVIMRDELVRRGFKIFVESPEHFTIRAQFPKGDNPFGVRDADFVLAREEGPYSDGRRPDWVKAGTLLMDQQRRDFTMNSVAQDEAGNFIDPFNGRQDIAEGVIRAVGSAFDRLTEDALRAVRALRFSVTKEFRIDREVEFAMETKAVLDSIVNQISDERINDELSKMFRFDTLASLSALSRYPALTRAMFAGSVSLDSTMKTKGRGRP